MLSSSSDRNRILQLEELAFAGWPALETRDSDGWRLRFSGGYTKRANSISALSPDARIDPETVARLEAAYTERGLTPVWRLSPLAPADFADKMPRYRAIECSLMQVCPLSDRFVADPVVAIHPQPTPAWIQAFAAYSPVPPEHQDTMRRMLAAIAAPAGFAFVEEAGQPLAMAIGAVQGDHMGLFDVLVMPRARRRGLARKVTESLYAWAWRRGVRHAYLQVVATNEAAMPLYAAQGFRTAYAYEYRIP